MYDIWKNLLKYINLEHAWHAICLLQSMWKIQSIFFFFWELKKKTKWKIQSKCDTKHAMHYVLFYCTKLMQIRNNFRWHLFIIEPTKYTLWSIVYKIKKN